MEKVDMMIGLKINKFQKKKHSMMSKYTINNGKFIGKFEELYKKFDNPFLQTEMEKYETTKKIILNYVNELKDKNKKKLKTLEIGCGFGKLTNDLKNIGVNSYGIDISEIIICKVYNLIKAKCRNLSYCPERIIEGFSLEELPVIPQIVSASNKLTLSRNKRLFRKITNHFIDFNFFSFRGFL